MGITCTLPALVPTKTAAGEWDRTVTWELAKSVDAGSHTGYAGDSFDSTWTVVADKNDSGPMNFVVAGKIEVYNPAAIAQTFTVGDVLNDLAGTAAAVDCPSLTVDPLATVTCTYEASRRRHGHPQHGHRHRRRQPAAERRRRDRVDREPHRLRLGRPDRPALHYDENISGDTTVDLRRDVRLLDRPDRYTNGSLHRHVHEHGLPRRQHRPRRASAEVGITCHLPALVPTKTAAGEWDRTVTWSSTKSVDAGEPRGLRRRQLRLDLDGGRRPRTTAAR